MPVRPATHRSLLPLRCISQRVRVSTTLKLGFDRSGQEGGGDGVAGASAGEVPDGSGHHDGRRRAHLGFRSNLIWFRSLWLGNQNQRMNSAIILFPQLMLQGVGRLLQGVWQIGRLRSSRRTLPRGVQHL